MSGATRPGLWLDHLHPDDLERVREANEGANRTGEPVVIEYRFRKADGSYVWVHDQASAVSTRGGRPGLLAGLHPGLTERKQAEERLERALRSSARRPNGSGRSTT